MARLALLTSVAAKMATRATATSAKSATRKAIGPRIAIGRTPKVMAKVVRKELKVKRELKARVQEAVKVVSSTKGSRPRR